MFLANTIVLASYRHGNQRKCKAVLDYGSQINFISGSLANRLHLKTKRATLPVSGIGASRVRAVSYNIVVSIKSRVTDYNVDLLCYILPTIVMNFHLVLNVLNVYN